MARYRYRLRRRLRRGLRGRNGRLAASAIAAGVVLAVLAGHHAAPGTGGGDGAAVAAPCTSCPSNEALANSMAASGYGWTGGQATCLDALWNRETGGTWDPLITNTQSGAFGIAQALGHGQPGTTAVVTEHYLDGTMKAQAAVNEYPSQAANRGNPVAQIRWGLGDIRDVYGTPCVAWNHEVSAGWY